MDTALFLRVLRIFQLVRAAEARASDVAMTWPADLRCRMQRAAHQDESTLFSGEFFAMLRSTERDSDSD
jgi:hypothetical protein